VYTVTGYQNNCYNSQQFTITVVPSPVINITSDLIIYEGNSVTLSASGGGAYVWSPNENISCTNCDSIIVSPTKSTTYCVEVTGANSCSNSKCVNVTVDINCGELFVPNAFSPNEDGINDVLHVKINPKCVSGFTILIFDRWGEKIFESDDLNFSWDGTFRGKALNTSVFVYHIKLKLHNKELLTKKGNITLIK
jgi:gliding motility-associated-like protein